MKIVNAKEVRDVLRSIKDQQMTIEQALEMASVFEDDVILFPEWDVNARKALGWDKPIVLPMPKGRGARRG